MVRKSLDPEKTSSGPPQPETRLLKCFLCFRRSALPITLPPTPQIDRLRRKATQTGSTRMYTLDRHTPTNLPQHSSNVYTRSWHSAALRSKNTKRFRERHTDYIKALHALALSLGSIEEATADAEDRRRTQEAWRMYRETSALARKEWLARVQKRLGLGGVARTKEVEKRGDEAQDWSVGLGDAGYDVGSALDRFEAGSGATDRVDEERDCQPRGVQFAKNSLEVEGGSSEVRLHPGTASMYACRTEVQRVSSPTPTAESCSSSSIISIEVAFQPGTRPDDDDVCATGRVAGSFVAPIVARSDVYNSSDSQEAPRFRTAKLFHQSKGKMSLPLMKSWRGKFGLKRQLVEERFPEDNLVESQTMSLGKMSLGTFVIKGAGRSHPLSMARGYQSAGSDVPENWTSIFAPSVRMARAKSRVGQIENGKKKLKSPSLHSASRIRDSSFAQVFPTGTRKTNSPRIAESDVAGMKGKDVSARTTPPRDSPGTTTIHGHPNACSLLPESSDEEFLWTECETRLQHVAVEAARKETTKLHKMRRSEGSRPATTLVRGAKATLVHFEPPSKLRRKNHKPAYPFDAPAVPTPVNLPWEAVWHQSQLPEEDTIKRERTVSPASTASSLPYSLSQATDPSDPTQRTSPSRQLDNVPMWRTRNPYRNVSSLPGRLPDLASLVANDVRAFINADDGHEQPF